MKSEETLGKVLNYWDGLRGNRRIPRRSEIDPRELEFALDATFILERVGPGNIRIRIAGETVCRLLAVEPRGMPVTSMFEPAERERAQLLVDHVFIGEEMTELDLHAPATDNRPPLSGRMLLLPLADERGETTRALGCLVLDRQPAGTGPRRLAVRAVRHVDSRGEGRWRQLKPAGEAPGLAEPTRPFRIVRQGAVAARREEDAPAGSIATPECSKGRPQLRLVRKKD